VRFTLNYCESDISISIVGAEECVNDHWSRVEGLGLLSIVDRLMKLMFTVFRMIRVGLNFQLC